MISCSFISPNAGSSREETLDRYASIVDGLQARSCSTYRNHSLAASANVTSTPSAPHRALSRAASSTLRSHASAPRFVTRPAAARPRGADLLLGLPAIGQPALGVPDRALTALDPEHVPGTPADLLELHARLAWDLFGTQRAPAQ